MPTLSDDLLVLPEDVLLNGGRNDGARRDVDASMARSPET